MVPLIMNVAEARDWLSVRKLLKADALKVLASPSPPTPFFFNLVAFPLARRSHFRWPPAAGALSLGRGIGAAHHVIILPACLVRIYCCV